MPVASSAWPGEEGSLLGCEVGEAGLASGCEVGEDEVAFGGEPGKAVAGAGEGDFSSLVILSRRGRLKEIYQIATGI